MNIESARVLMKSVQDYCGLYKAMEYSALTFWQIGE